MRTSAKSELLRWGILSTGRIAGIFSDAVRRSRTGRLVAVASRDRASARAFARKFHIPKAYGDYPSLLKDPSVEAVYVAPPHPMHLRWTLEALEAGKHVLCEKPLGVTYGQGKRMVEAARRRRRFLMEAFMYRCHPQTLKLAQWIRQGLIGEVRFIQASFCFDAPLNLKNRLFNKALGGGGILDVGCYPVSMARLLAGAALGRPFVEPSRIKGTGILGKKSGVDESAVAVLKFPGGILAELSCAIRADRGHSRVKVDGTKGSLTVPSPWFAQWHGGTSTMVLELKGKKPRKVPVHCGRNLYTVEADEVARCIRGGLKQSPAMGWADTLGNLRVLDAWRAQVGRG